MFVRKLQEEAEQLFHEYIATPQQLLELTGRRGALLPRCHQLSHMQQAAGRGQSAWSLSHYGDLSGCIVGVI